MKMQGIKELIYIKVIFLNLYLIYIITETVYNEILLYIRNNLY